MSSLRGPAPSRPGTTQLPTPTRPDSTLTFALAVVRRLPRRPLASVAEMRKLPQSTRELWVETARCDVLERDIVVRYSDLTGREIPGWRVVGWWPHSEAVLAVTEALDDVARQIRAGLGPDGIEVAA